ncbi:serine/threonine-protein kinase STY46 [Panicum miliaceum]|uniref:Serine/threonine-protein kinase STY46 n=1 Tax=Panicum miliaceum TaxID=4540 RepID=A0A3L6SCT1_PANMI|nr:serine/threonine-protein kinase STY46 [Panicum miliaceum]
MAAALECWSGRPSTDEEMVEQVLMKPHGRSDDSLPTCADSAYAGEPTSAPAPPKKWQRLGRNFAGAIAAFKNTLSLDGGGLPRDPSPRAEKPPPLLLRGLAQLYSRGANNQQLPEKLVADLRRHFDALPNSYAQAGFDMKDVLLHARLVEQATGSLDSPSFCCKKIQIFEKRGLTLGVVMILVQSGNEVVFKNRVESALKSVVKKQRKNGGGVKLPFGLCGCQEEGSRNFDEESMFDPDDGQVLDNEPIRRPQLPTPLPQSSVFVSVDEWQTIQSGGEELGRWMLRSEEIEFIDWVGANSFKGVFRGKKVWVNKLRGCDMGSAYDVEIRQDLLQLMSCGQRNILQFHGICFNENHGLCIVTRMMEGGSVHDIIMQRNKRLSLRDTVRIALDVADGLAFMNSYGIAYRDLNSRKILLDRQGNACLGDMGIVTPCNNVGEVTEYETSGYRWLAPEIIAGDPETVSETWMSNVYSYGMVLWEMITGEEAYSTYSPVQAAVGIAACGLRPEIPRDCPPFLRSLMNRCWDNNPLKRPQFSEIISILQRQNAR